MKFVAMNTFLFLCIASVDCTDAFVAHKNRDFQPQLHNHRLDILARRHNDILRKRTELTSLGVSAVTASVSREIQNSAIRAVAKLLSTCGIGIWSAKQGILDSTAIGVLSKLVFNVFQPCLLFVSVAQTIAAQSSVKGSKIGYILPLAAILQILIGYCVGKLACLLPLGKRSPTEKKQLLQCTTFGNSGPLPLVFTDALFRLAPDKSLLPRSAAYISLYLLGWSPIFWVLGTSILGKNDDVTQQDKLKLLKKTVIR